MVAFPAADILVTGFEPFGGVADNPSQWLATTLAVPGSGVQSALHAVQGPAQQTLVGFIHVPPRGVIEDARLLTALGAVLAAIRAQLTPAHSDLTSKNR